MPEHIIWLRSPDRYYERTSMGWYDRPWEQGEREHYCRTVLHREPYDSETTRTPRVVMADPVPRSVRIMLRLNDLTADERKQLIKDLEV